MKSPNPNKSSQTFICDGGCKIDAKPFENAHTAFEEALKTTSRLDTFARSTVDAIDLPFEEAIRFFRDKANVTTKHWHDVYAAANARAFMVAGAATDALVEDFRQAIDKAIADGTTLNQFRKDFDQIVALHGWTGWKGEENKAMRAWRTQIIYDTNLRTAYAAGRYAAMTQPETLEVFPYWQYHHSGSMHPRHEHLSWDGLVLRADDPFWSSNYPPNGWHCGCYVTPVSHGGLERQGKTKPDPSPELLSVSHDVGDKQVMVPKGVDPGFEYNPGREWLSRTAPGSDTIAASSGMIERFVKAAMRKSIIDNTYIPVAITPKKMAKYYGVNAGTEVRLSKDTIESHLKHSAATPSIYAGIVEHALSEGVFIENESGRISNFVHYEGSLWLVGIKRTQSGELYITTVHPTEQRKFNSAKKRGKTLEK